MSAADLPRTAVGIAAAVRSGAVKAVAVAPVKVVRKVVSRCVGGVCRQEVIEVQATSSEQPSVVVKAVATTEVRRTVQRSRFRFFRGR